LLFVRVKGRHAITELELRTTQLICQKEPKVPDSLANDTRYCSTRATRLLTPASMKPGLSILPCSCFPIVIEWGNLIARL
jgi:hypothetical protein